MYKTVQLDQLEQLQVHLKIDNLELLSTFEGSNSALTAAIQGTYKYLSFPLNETQ